MSNLAATELKTFVPSKDFERSKRFYQDLGFKLAWSSEDLACLHVDECSFLLQAFYLKEHAENFMMHLLVEDVEAWWQAVRSAELDRKYGIPLTPPADRPWGIRDFAIQDPAGVCWRIGQNIDINPAG
jgi:catechol 2,3-dioxygenase-like lactoylglutathione lyase family enzyme